MSNIESFGSPLINAEIIVPVNESIDPPDISDSIYWLIEYTTPHIKFKFYICQCLSTFRENPFHQKSVQEEGELYLARWSVPCLAMQITVICLRLLVQLDQPKASGLQTHRYL